MKDALISVMSSVPASLRGSLMWDRGKEFCAHALFTEATGTLVYFADAKSLWQRGSNEHLGGLLRQYFPKGTDLSRWGAAEIAVVAGAMNSRRDEYPAPGGPGLEDTCRSLRRSATLGPPVNRCDHRLSTAYVRSFECIIYGAEE